MSFTALAKLQLALLQIDQQQNPRQWAEAKLVQSTGSAQVRQGSQVTVIYVLSLSCRDVGSIECLLQSPDTQAGNV